jgi:hypothetical protein
MNLPPGTAIASQQLSDWGPHFVSAPEQLGELTQEPPLQ